MREMREVKRITFPVRMDIFERGGKKYSILGRIYPFYVTRSCSFLHALFNLPFPVFLLFDFLSFSLESNIILHSMF